MVPVPSSPETTQSGSDKTDWNNSMTTLSLKKKKLHLNHPDSAIGPKTGLKIRRILSVFVFLIENRMINNVLF